MTVAAARRRGQPLAVLLALVLGWIGARAMVWESPFPDVPLPFGESAVFAGRTAESAMASADVGPGSGTGAWNGFRRWTAPDPAPDATLLAADAIAPARMAALNGETMAGHHLLWLAATADLPVPPEIASLMRAKADPSGGALGPIAPFPGAPKRIATEDRWSFDSWLLLRPGGGRNRAAAALAPGYGGSQAGAVVRYRLAPASHVDPSAHLRAAKAFGRDGDFEIAAGLSARPLGALPVALHSELRLARRGTVVSEVRPAVFAVTELPAADLPLGLRGEAYAQAGYVGGRFATAFVDGQARIDRLVADFDLATLRAGAGTWGGAQKGAARLDLGPTASLDLEVGGAPARLAVDYRVRVAGEAAPGSGVAVTLSTGF